MHKSIHQDIGKSYCLHKTNKNKGKTWSSFICTVLKDWNVLACEGDPAGEKPVRNLLLQWDNVLAHLRTPQLLITHTNAQPHRHFSAISPHAAGMLFHPRWELEPTETRTIGLLWGSFFLQRKFNSAAIRSHNQNINYPKTIKIHQLSLIIFSHINTFIYKTLSQSPKSH